MAGSSAQIKNIKDTSHQGRESQLSRNTQFEKRDLKPSALIDLMEETSKYEKYAMYWSILSNVGAVISIAGAIFGAVKKRSWL